MTWAKMDDLYDDHPKVKRAWRRNRASVALHTMAITYSSRHETDGVVELEWLEEKIPGAKERESAIGTLVDCRLLDPMDGERFQVHDYLDYNPSREQLESKRTRDAKRKASARNPDGHDADSTRTDDGIHADSNGIPNGASRALPRATPAARPVPAPNPTRDQRG